MRGRDTLYWLSQDELTFSSVTLPLVAHPLVVKMSPDLSNMRIKVQVTRLHQNLSVH